VGNGNTVKDLFERMSCKVLEQVMNARWRLFGHTLRMNEHTPARKAMTYYLTDDHEGSCGKRITIATAPSDEYKNITGVDIKNVCKTMRQ
jgi:hypothetical protein